MSLATVSGNTVSGNTPPPPGSDTVPGTVTNNNTYTIDNTAVCDLLTALLDEEVKQNEALTQLNETLAAHAESLAESNLSYGLQGKILAEDLKSEASTEETEEAAEADSKTLLDLLQTISDTLTGSQETLDSMNKTVSGNNAFLDSMYGTVTTLQETYTEQTEKNTESESYSLSIDITILFGMALIVGILLSGIFWKKMR